MCSPFARSAAALYLLAAAVTAAAPAAAQTPPAADAYPSWAYPWVPEFVVSTATDVP